VTASMDTSAILTVAITMKRNGFCFLHLQLGTKLNLPGSNLREYRQSILNLEFLDFPMTEFLTVTH